MKLWQYAILSTTIAAVAARAAWRAGDAQLFPACAAIARSRVLSLAVGNGGVALAVVLFAGVARAVFGTVRDVEAERCVLVFFCRGIIRFSPEENHVA